MKRIPTHGDQPTGARIVTSRRDVSPSTVRAHPARPLDVATVLALQRQAGNRAVSRLVEQATPRRSVTAQRVTDPPTTSNSTTTTAPKPVPTLHGKPISSVTVQELIHKYHQTFAFRGAPAPPREVFQHGFTAAGTNPDVRNHLSGAADRGYVSLSLDWNISATSYPFNEYAGRPENARDTGWVYAIDLRRLENEMLVDADAVVPGDKNQAILVYRSIPASAIAEAKEVRRKPEKIKLGEPTGANQKNTVYEQSLTMIGKLDVTQLHIAKAVNDRNYPGIIASVEAWDRQHPGEGLPADFVDQQVARKWRDMPFNRREFLRAMSRADSNALRAVQQQEGAVPDAIPSGCFPLNCFGCGTRDELKKRSIDNAAQSCPSGYRRINLTDTKFRQSKVGNNQPPTDGKDRWTRAKAASATLSYNQYSDTLALDIDTEAWYFSKTYGDFYKDGYDKMYLAGVIISKGGSTVYTGRTYQKISSDPFAPRFEGIKFRGWGEYDVKFFFIYKGGAWGSIDKASPMTWEPGLSVSQFTVNLKDDPKSEYAPLLRPQPGRPTQTVNTGGRADATGEAPVDYGHNHVSLTLENVTLGYNPSSATLALDMETQSLISRGPVGQGIPGYGTPDESEKEFILNVSVRGPKGGKPYQRETGFRVEEGNDYHVMESKTFPRLEGIEFSGWGKYGVDIELTSRNVHYRNTRDDESMAHIRTSVQFDLKAPPRQTRQPAEESAEVQSLARMVSASKIFPITVGGRTA